MAARVRAVRCCDGQIASTGSLDALSRVQDKVVKVLDPIELVALGRLEQADVLVHDVPSDKGRRLEELVAAGHFAADFRLVLDLIVLGQDARSDAVTVNAVMSRLYVLVDIVAAKVDRVGFRAIGEQDQPLVEIFEPGELCPH